MQWVKIAAMGLGLALASPALAQKVANFNIAGVDFEVTLPAGSCLPEGAMAQAAAVLASADKSNQTLLTIVTCGDDGFDEDYYAIKVPLGYIATEIDRPAFLKEMEPVFGKARSDGQFAGAVDTAADAMTDTLGQRVTLTGTIEPLGMDATCAYLGGILEVKTEGIQRTAVVAGCITAVSRKPIVIYSAGLGDKPEDVARHVRSARALADSIRPKRGN